MAEPQPPRPPREPQRDPPLPPARATAPVDFSDGEDAGAGEPPEPRPEADLEPRPSPRMVEAIKQHILARRELVRRPRGFWEPRRRRGATVAGSRRFENRGTGRGAAAAATSIFRGDESRRRRGLRRGDSAETGRGAVDVPPRPRDPAQAAFLDDPANRDDPRAQKRPREDDTFEDEARKREIEELEEKLRTVWEPKRHGVFKMRSVWSGRVPEHPVEVSAKFEATPRRRAGSGG